MAAHFVVLADLICSSDLEASRRAARVDGVSHPVKDASSDFRVSDYYLCNRY